MFRLIMPLFQGTVLLIACAPLLIGSSTLIGQITGSAGAAFVTMAVIAALGTAGATLFTDRPVLVAPYMGLTAICCFNLYWGNGIPYSTILLVVAITGSVLVAISVTGIAGHILNAVPPVLVAAMGAAVGLAMASVGLRYAGIIVSHPLSDLAIGSLAARVPLVVGTGLIAGFSAYSRNHKYYLEIGAAVSLFAALCVGLVSSPELTVSLSPYSQLNFPVAQIPTSLPVQWEGIISLALLIVLDTLAMLVVLRECFSLSEQQINRVSAVNGACLIVCAVLGAPGVALVPESSLARVQTNRWSAPTLWLGGLLIIGSVVPGLIAYSGVGLDFGRTGLQYPLVSSILLLGGLTLTTALRGVDWSNRESSFTVGTVILLAVFGGSIATAFVGGLGVIAISRMVTRKAGTLPQWCYLTLGLGIMWRLIS